MRAECCDTSGRENNAQGHLCERPVVEPGGFVKRLGLAGGLLWLLSSSLLLQGCGYRLAGGGILPESIRVIALKPFTNETSRTEIEQRVLGPHFEA